MSLALLYTWELPQSLLGLALYALLRLRGGVLGIERRPDGRRLIETRGTAISLGAWVYWARFGLDGAPFERNLIRAHELGHTVQSRRHGPLYLLTVGLPSVSRAAYAWWFLRRTGRAWAHYFDAWPEDDADRLGGIRRDARGRRFLAHPPP